ncbi:MAG: catalase-related domain-containing protein, partial [Burkholderiaceae bacterium]
VHNNQRDGMHRQAIARGRVAYEPNSLAGGCPFQAGARGFVSFPDPMQEDKVRGKPERFAEHYTQATLFWNSQSAVEKAHIVRAFRFELTRVQIAAIRERVVSMLANVADALARAVADGLGIDVPMAMPMVAPKVAKPEVKASTALSLFARPGDGSIKTRRIALLVAEGVDLDALGDLHTTLSGAGAVPRFVGMRLGRVEGVGDEAIDVEVTMEAAPAVLFDALVIPDGAAGIEALSADGQAVEFVKDQYRHCKPILVLGSGVDLLAKAGIPSKLPSGDHDPGLLQFDAAEITKAAAAFAAAIGKHRHFARQTDPPAI